MPWSTVTRDRPAIAKAFVYESVIVNLSLLGFFKYSGLLVSTFNSATGLSVPVPEVTLPIGISFYTFQSMSYTIDIYRNRAPRQHHIVDYGTYVSFFPYLVAGPIVRYEVLALQVMNRQETLEKFTQGAQRFLVGLFKKVILANNVAALADKVQFFGDPSTLSAWLGILAFTFQIYFGLFRVFRHGHRPWQDVWVYLAGKLQFAVYLPQRAGILDPLAYDAGRLV